MDANTLAAKKCKEGHPRIWYTVGECPLCESIRWGRKQLERKNQAVEELRDFKQIWERFKREML